MAKDKLELGGIVFHYRYGPRWFECRHSRSDNIVYVLAGTSPLFTGELVFTSVADSETFFTHWLTVYIDGLENPFKK